MPGDAIHPPPKDGGPLAQRLMDNSVRDRPFDFAAGGVA